MACNRYQVQCSLSLGCTVSFTDCGSAPHNISLANNEIQFFCSEAPPSGDGTNAVIGNDCTCLTIYEYILSPNPQSGPFNYFGIKLSIDQIVNENITITGYLRDDENHSNTYPYTLVISGGTFSSETANNVLQTSPTGTATNFITGVTPTSGLTTSLGPIDICGASIPAAPNATATPTPTITSTQTPTATTTSTPTPTLTTTATNTPTPTIGLTQTATPTITQTSTPTATTTSTPTLTSTSTPTPTIASGPCTPNTVTPKGVLIQLNSGSNYTNCSVLTGLTENTITGVTSFTSITGGTIDLTGLSPTLLEVYVKMVCVGCCEQIYKVNLDECCDFTPSTTNTPTPTVTSTATPTPTVGVTQTATPTVTSTQTPTPTVTSTQTPTPTIEFTQTTTPTVTSTSTQTTTPTYTPTNSPTPTITTPFEFCFDYTISTVDTPSSECPGYNDTKDVYTFTFKDNLGNTINAPTTFDLIISGFTNLGGGGSINASASVTVTAGSSSAVINAWTYETLDGAPGCVCPCASTTTWDVNTIQAINIVGGYTITECLVPTATPTLTATLTPTPYDCECFSMTYTTAQLPVDLYVRYSPCTAGSIVTELISNLPGINDNLDGTFTAYICVNQGGSYPNPICVQNGNEVVCPTPLVWTPNFTSCTSYNDCMIF